ncbi:MAG: putative toxin-antitoxin system toxin component, PIN family [Blastocatellia bacterium]
MTRYLVVFDTVAIVQGVINPKGAAGKCLACFHAGEIAVAISRAALREISDVLSRPALRDRFPQITDEKVVWLTGKLLDEGLYVRNVPSHFTYPRDPKDEPYINLAIEVAADFLVSRDHDLLDLMDWHREEGREFQKRFRALRMVTPEEFLRGMEQPAP